MKYTGNLRKKIRKTLNYFTSERKGWGGKKEKRKNPLSLSLSLSIFSVTSMDECSFTFTRISAVVSGNGKRDSSVSEQRYQEFYRLLHRRKLLSQNDISQGKENISTRFMG
jgi:hypothetical protein